VAASPISGKVQTVLGPVDPESLGATITHEHLLIDFTVVFQPPNNPKSFRSRTLAGSGTTGTARWTT